jgi:hypothetical protein
LHKYGIIKYKIKRKRQIMSQSIADMLNDKSREQMKSLINTNKTIAELRPGEGYGEWQYDYNECKLYTISTSSQGTGTEYLLFYKSDEPSYFQAKSSGSSTSIYIYKLINISPGEEEPINNVEITEIATPKTGKAPDISAETSSNKYFLFRFRFG